MQLHIETIQGARVIRPVTPVLDASNAAELRARLAHELTGVRHLVVDLSSARTIDADGLTALLECWHFAREHRVRLGLCGMSTRARLAARLLALENIVPIAENVDEALSALGIPRPAPAVRDLAVSAAGGARS